MDATRTRTFAYDVARRLIGESHASYRQHTAYNAWGEPRRTHYETDANAPAEFERTTHDELGRPTELTVQTALSAEDFVARFVEHVLPTGFVKIRHYGLHAATRLEQARAILMRETPGPQPAPAPPSLVETPASDWRLLLLDLSALDLELCPR